MFFTEEEILETQNKTNIKQTVLDFLNDAKIIFQRLNLTIEPKLVYKQKKQNIDITGVVNLDNLLLQTSNQQRLDFFFHLPTPQDRIRFVTELLSFNNEKWIQFKTAYEQGIVPPIFPASLNSHTFVIIPKSFVPVAFIIKFTQTKISHRNDDPSHLPATHKTTFREALQCIFCQGILSIDEHFFDKIDIKELQQTLTFDKLSEFSEATQREKEVQKQFEDFIAFLSLSCDHLLQNGYDVIAELKNININILTKNYQQNKLLITDPEEFYSWIETAKSVKNFLKEQNTDTGSNYYFERTDNFKKLKTKFTAVNKDLPKQQRFSQINKWNTADIWAISIPQKSKIYREIEQTTSLKELNAVIKEGLLQQTFIGISLKKIKEPDKAHIKTYNLDDAPLSIKIEPNEELQTVIIAGGMKSYLTSAMGQIYAFETTKEKQIKIEFRFDKKNFEPKYLNTEIVFYDLSSKSQFRLGKTSFSSLVKHINNFDVISSYTKTFFQKFLSKTEVKITKEHFQEIKRFFQQLLTQTPPTTLELHGEEIFADKIASTTHLASTLQAIYDRLKKLNTFSDQFSFNKSRKIAMGLPDTENLFFQDLFQLFLRKLQISNNFDTTFHDWQQWFVVIDLFSQLILHLLDTNELESFITEVYKLSTAQTALSSAFIVVSP